MCVNNHSVYTDSTTRSIPLAWCRCVRVPMTWELCQLKHKLLAGSPMLERSKGRGQTNLDHLSSRLRGWDRANNSWPDIPSLLQKHRRQNRKNQTLVWRGLHAEGVWRIAVEARWKVAWPTPHLFLHQRQPPRSPSSSFSSSAFPSYISGVHHLGWDFCECGRFLIQPLRWLHSVFVDGACWVCFCYRHSPV